MSEEDVKRFLALGLDRSLFFELLFFELEDQNTSGLSKILKEQDAEKLEAAKAQGLKDLMAMGYNPDALIERSKRRNT